MIAAVRAGEIQQYHELIRPYERSVCVMALFNIFNHPNFGPPTNSLTGPFFGYFDADAGERPGRARQRRLQSSLSNRRTAVDPACGKAAVFDQSRSMGPRLQQPSLSGFDPAGNSGQDQLPGASKYFLRVPRNVQKGSDATVARA